MENESNRMEGNKANTVLCNVFFSRELFGVKFITDNE